MTILMTARKPAAKKREMTLYMCGVDWQHELGQCDVTMYPSVKVLKQMRTCWDECGIVRVKATFEHVRWVSKQDFLAREKWKGAKK